LFLPDHSEFRSVGPASLSPKRFLLKSKDWKLDLGSLGRLFQNQPKIGGLWGTDIPRVHQKDKRPHERPKGPIIRKVIPLVGLGETTSEADRHKAGSVQAQTA
jgi:hypothetical protein